MGFWGCHFHWVTFYIICPPLTCHHNKHLLYANWWRGRRGGRGGGGIYCSCELKWIYLLSVTWGAAELDTIACASTNYKTLLLTFSMDKAEIAFLVAWGQADSGVMCSCYWERVNGLYSRCRICTHADQTWVKRKENRRKKTLLLILCICLFQQDPSSHYCI